MNRTNTIAEHTIHCMDKEIRPMYANVMNVVRSDPTYTSIGLADQLTDAINIIGVSATIHKGKIFFVFESSKELAWMKLRWY